MTFNFLYLKLSIVIFYLTFHDFGLASDIHFERVQKRLNLTGRFHLEDFYAMSRHDFHTYPVLEDLIISFHFPNAAISIFGNGEHDEFYNKAVENLKRTAPNLKTVTLEGGYVFNPVEDNAASFENEVPQLRVHIDHVVKSIIDAELNLTAVRFVAMYTFSPDSLVNTSAVFKKTFNVDLSEQALEVKILDLKYTSYGVDIELLMQLNLSMMKNKGVSLGRSMYYNFPLRK